MCNEIEPGTGVEIRGNFLTGHNFTNQYRDHGSRRGEYIDFLAFPYLKGKLTLLEKTSK